MGTALPSTIARYKILKRLGEGGMGSLYLARDPAIDRLIAIKVLREDVESDELRERFMREAKAVGKLKHQNIVMVFDVGQDAGRPFIAMEYIEGYTLGLVVREKRNVDILQKLTWLEEMCAGLGYAHKQGIIHRDVKPANIMVDQDGTLKILDFGIARLGSAASSGMTQTGTLMGTLSYMSPEQMTGKPVDHRSDIFAVGAVCYEMISYNRAFPGDIQDGVLHRIIHEPPKALEQLVPNIDPRLVNIINKALEKDRDVRYQDLEAMKKDFAKLRMQLEDGVPPPPVHHEPPVDRTIVVPSPITSNTQSSVIGQKRDPKERRAQQIEKLMDTAFRALDSGAIERAQQAVDEVLYLDPDHPEAITLSQRVQETLEGQRVSTIIQQVKSKLAAGAAEDAARIVADGLEANPDSPDLQTLQNEIAAEQERQLEVRQFVERGEAKLGQRAYDAALEFAEQALALDPKNQRALQLKQKGGDAIARIRQQEEERKRAEAEAERKRKESEAAAQKRAQEEAAKKAAAEAAAKEAAARKAAEEAAKKKAAEEAAAKKAAADAAARKAAEEAAARKAAEEAAKREAAAKRAAEEARKAEEARQRAALEETQRADVTPQPPSGEGTVIVPPPTLPERQQAHSGQTQRIVLPPVAEAEKPVREPSTRTIRPVPVPVPEPYVEPVPEPAPAPKPPKPMGMIAGIAAAVVLVAALGAWMVLKPKPVPGPEPGGGGGGVAPSVTEGTLSLNITPYAQIVSITGADGKKVPTELCPVTPCLVSLAPGAYNVQAKNPDFGPNVYSFSVTVTAGQEIVSNQPFPGFEPRDAVKVILNGRD